MNKKEEQTKQSLQEEVTSLKRQLAGSRGRNKQLVNEISELKEGISEKDKTIKGLQSQVAALRDLLTERDAETKELREEYDTFTANYNYIKSSPWYKRIFFKM